MKKTICLVIIASFVFGLGATRVLNAQEMLYTNNAVTTSASVSATSSVEGLEKISSPDQIRYFQVMKRIGDALFGIRKSTSTQRVEDKKPELNREEQNKLEKIDHPALINMFERIQKIGTALWGIKRKATSTPATPFIISPETAVCVAAAIDVKDKSLMARVTSAATELNVALAARSLCQQNAVKASTTPRDVLNGCVKDFNHAQKAIKDASKQTQKDAWTTYQNSLKACRPATSSPAIPMIEDGGNLFD